MKRYICGNRNFLKYAVTYLLFFMITFAYAFETASCLIKTLKQDTLTCMIDFDLDDETEKEDTIKKSDKFYYEPWSTADQYKGKVYVKNESGMFSYDARYTSSNHRRIIECPPEA